MSHTIEGVEICSVGMDWPASTGGMTITFENIADAIVAANEDPLICSPRGKLGHYSSLNEGIPMWDPFEQLGDAAPAFGTFRNLRATNDGATLVGDAVDVPDWITAGSYPSRSMESVGNVRTAGGKTYSMVVTGVAWLGTELPAVADLEDLTALIEGGPEMVKQAGSISATTIRQKFHEWCDEEESEAHYWWWARDVRLEPNEVIADDDEGNLFRVPFETDGGESVEFGEPVRVVEQFVDAKAATAFSRPKERLENKVAASVADHEQEEGNMDQDQVQDLPATDEDEAVTEEIVEEETSTEEAFAAAEASQVERLSAENAELRERLDRMEAAAVADRRDSRIAEHVAAGRLSPADRDEYRELMDLDEERVERMLASRPASVPVGERGEVVEKEADAEVGVGEDGLLPANVSLLTAAERRRSAR